VDGWALFGGEAAAASRGGAVSVEDRRSYLGGQGVGPAPLNLCGPKASVSLLSSSSPGSRLDGG